MNDTLPSPFTSSAFSLFGGNTSFDFNSSKTHLSDLFPKNWGNEFLPSTPSQLPNTINPKDKSEEFQHPNGTTSSNNLTSVNTPQVVHLQVEPCTDKSQAIEVSTARTNYDEVLEQIITKNSQKDDYIDVTPYITLSQEDAAKKLGIPSSTLSKRWREATMNRKWPFRSLCKFDREIKTLLHNIKAGCPMDPQVEASLGLLLKKRQEESRVVFIKKAPIK